MQSIENQFQLMKKNLQEQGPLNYQMRKGLLQNLLFYLNSKEEIIAKALKLDLGKCLFESYATEIASLKKECKVAIKNLKSWMAPQKVKTPLSLLPGKSFILPQAKGVVLIISPWNYPISLAISPLIMAICAGNRVFLKPSEFSPHTSKVIEELTLACFPQDIVMTVQGNGEVSEKLTNLPFDHIFFTGSTAIGKKVYQAAAKNLTPVTLELGGKSPVVLFADAHLPFAAKRIVWGKFINLGQTCVAPDYLLIHKSLEEKFITHFKNALTEFFGPKPENSQDLGKIINKQHFLRLKGLMEHIPTEDILCGGYFDEERFFISPTLVRRKNFDHPLMIDEIFGPILPYLTFENEDELPQLLSVHPTPLAFYSFSKDSKKSLNLMKHSSFGGGAINDTVIHLGNSNLPFGGIGQSGMGNYKGKFGFDTFSHQKALFKQSNAIDLPFRYPPYTKLKFKILRFFLGN